jgi:phosphohistidine phosphatase
LKTLYLLRHAKAAPESSLGDARRPLAKRGRKAARTMADFLGTLTPAPELILCSTSVRTRETLDLILPAFNRPPTVTYEDGLYLASATELIERLRKVRNDTSCVLVLGHNPGLHELGARLAIDPGRLAEGFPTAAFAALQVPGSWVELQWQKAKLVHYQTPKELTRDSDPEAD